VVIVDSIAYLFYLAYRALWYIADYAKDIPFVGTYLQAEFLNAADYFYDLSAKTYEFSAAMGNILTEIGKILSWDTIWSYILSYVPNLEAIRDWFYHWRDWVLQEVTGWWSATSTTVLGWIDAATQGLADLMAAWDNFRKVTFPEWTGRINSLESGWSNFWEITFPTLVSFSWLSAWWSDKLLDIQSLIDSAFLARDSFWQGWQDWRDKVTEFFTDPEEWLYKAVDRIIERFW